MNNTPIGLGESKVSTAPAFLITRESYGYSVAVMGFPDARFKEVDMTSRAARWEFIQAVGVTFWELAHGDGLMALIQAVKELAAGQPCAGTTVNEVRAIIMAIAAGVTAADPTPISAGGVESATKSPTKAERIRKMNLELAGVAK